MKIILNKLLSFNRKYWHIMTVFLLLIVTVLSLYPAASLPSAPGTDKTHHFLAYFLLTIPVALTRSKKWLWVCLLIFCISALIEVIQPYVNRYAEWLDLAANGLGIVCAILIGITINKFTTTMDTKKLS